jgi:uncharacterized protein YbjQ (UPF0145 family)
LTPGQRVVSAAGLNPSRSLVISQVVLAFGPSGPDPLLIHCRNRQVMGALVNRRATTAIDGRPVTKYMAVVTGEAVLGANVFRDLFAGLRYIAGADTPATRGPRGRQERALEETVTEAEQKGADAVVGVDVDYESIQIEQGGSMLMVSASGPAVRP